MTMREDYQAVMDIMLGQQELNYKKIVVELAKQNPKLLLKIMNPDRNMFAVLAKDPWMTEVRGHIGNGDRIDAIKLIREKVGYGLKEAKDITDLADHYMRPMVAVSPDINHMSSGALELAQKIAS